MFMMALAAHAPPAEVKAFLIRREQCAHWAGEDPYDRVRSSEINAAMRRLRCGNVDAEEKRMRRLHAHSPAMMKLLDVSACD